MKLRNQTTQLDLPAVLLGCMRCTLVKGNAELLAHSCHREVLEDSHMLRKGLLSSSLNLRWKVSTATRGRMPNNL